MHDATMMRDLMKHLEKVVTAHGASRVIAVSVRLGALAPITPDHFREHFEHATRGTFADHARLAVRKDGDVTHPRAQDILVESVEVEE